MCSIHSTLMDWRDSFSICGVTRGLLPPRPRSIARKSRSILGKTRLESTCNFSKELRTHEAALAAAKDMASYQRTVELTSSSAETQAPGVDGCILCGGALEKCISDLFDTRFGIDGNYEVRRCLDCGLEQMFPVPTPTELKTLYESHYNFGG